MNVQIVHNQMDGRGIRVLHRQFEQHLSELDGGTVQRSKGEVTTGLWLYRAEDVGRTATFIFTVPSRLPARSRR
jgi:hypothetical protein